MVFESVRGLGEALHVKKYGVARPIIGSRYENRRTVSWHQLPTSDILASCGALFFGPLLQELSPSWQCC
jgi:hypothetical protein